MCSLKILITEKLEDNNCCLTLHEDIDKISQLGQKGRPGEKTVIRGEIHGQGPDGSLNHTSEVGMEAPTDSGTV